MDSIQIDGGIPLQGQVKIQGSKNAALPILAATILVRGKSYIENCPKITDVFQMQTLLECVGCKTAWDGNCLKVDASTACECRMPQKEAKSMRSSISLLGALVARCKEAFLYHPGGCVIGARPIDIHVEALRKMGVHFEEEEERLYANCKELTGANIEFKFPSVGATENVLLAAVLAKGDTWIYPAAKEPEIIALCEFLQNAGAWIEGIGTDRLHVRGVKSLQESSFRIPADRIVAGTYLTGCMIAGGSVLLQEAPVEQMQEVLKAAARMGTVFQTSSEGLFVQAPEKLKSPGQLVTAVYPGFPTDMQSPFLAAMTCAKGESILTEKIFENRFHIVEPLRRMGAEICIHENNAYISGIDRLVGADVEAEELRGGAALIMAGLGAQGHTRVTGCKYVYRGYENIARDLRELGARVYSI